MKEETSRTKKTLLNTIAGVANRFCNIILSFLLRTIFIHTLGIQYTGISSVFTDILTMLSLSELGISTAIATALYNPLHDNNRVEIRKLMKFYKNAYRIIAVFILIVGFALLPFLKYLISDVPDISENLYVIFMLYIIKTASSYLLVYKATILNADQKQYITKGLETLCTIIRYIVEIIFLIVFKNFMVYLILEIVMTIFQNIVVTRRAEKEYKYAFEMTNEKLDRKELKNLFKDIKGLSMYRISGSIGNSIDNILVSSFIGTTMVGMLSNYTLIRKQIEALILQFFNSVTPSIGNLVAEGNNEKQLLIFNRLFYISFIVVNFCAICLFILFNPFIEIWLGKKYLLNFPISFVISFDFFLYILLQAIASFRTANGLFVKGQYRPLITAILNIILSIILIKKMGIFGTILATIICRIITQWYDPYILFKDVFKSQFKKFYLKYWMYIFIFITGSILTFMISNLIKVSPIIDFILKLFVCLIVPNLWTILLTFKTNEFEYLKDFLNKKILKKIRSNKYV